MKSILLTTALAMSAGVTMFGQTSLDLTSQALLHQIRLEQQKNTGFRAPRKAGPVATSHVLVMMTVADGISAADYAADGVNVLMQRGNIAVAEVAVDDVERVASLQGVKGLQISREQRPMMNEARKSTGVDKIHAGTDLAQPYTGKGVITGIMDSGMDPNHINFKDANGNTRIKQLSYIRANAAGTDAISTVYSDEPDSKYPLSRYTTDSNSSYHGTHTMGIMAGGYRGNLKYALKTGTGEATVYNDSPNPFYGVAYDSDIVAACGTLGDAYIALGVESVLDYAYEHNQPAVVNLSLGSNTGGHDGYDALNQYLSLAGEEAIICVSAGNEGNYPIAITKTLTDDETEVKTFFHNFYFDSAYNGTDYENLHYGAQYIYSDDDTPLDVQFVIFNKKRGRVAQRFVVPTTSNGTATYYVSSSDYSTSSDDVLSSQLAQYFKGYVGIGSNYDSNVDQVHGTGTHSRYYALLDVYLQPNTEGLNADGNYVLGVIVNGVAGQRVDIYSDAYGIDFTSNGVDGWTDGSCNGSISSMACGENIVVVGSYNTRDDWGALDGVVYGYDSYYYPEEISSFSSYGTLIDGRNLPHICAPGATIVSSTNTYYIDSALSGGELTEGALQARYDGGSIPNFWEIAAGTSMSSPFVSGAIALWLEADPTLTISDVLDIIEKTAVKDEYVNGDKFTGDPVQWGAGKFDAYAGLKEVINRRAGVNDIHADSDNRLIVQALGGNNFNVFLGGEALSIKVYSTAGSLVKSVATDSNELNVDLSTLTPGIYIINANNRLNQRVVVK